MSELVKESVNATGKVAIVVRDALGKIKQEVVTHNLVVTAGLGFIASRMKDTGSPDQMSHMEVGTSSTAAAAGQTALVALVASSRTALTTAGGVVTASAVEYVTTFGPGVGTGALTEAGIFNAASAGTMLCRTVFSVVNKGASDSMTITWTVTVS